MKCINLEWIFEGRKILQKGIKINHLNWSVCTRKHISHKQQLRNCAKFCKSAHSFPRNGKYLKDKKFCLQSCSFLGEAGTKVISSDSGIAFVCHEELVSV